MKIALLAPASESPAPLALLVSPGVFVAQGSSLDLLERLVKHAFRFTSRDEDGGAERKPRLSGASPSYPYYFRKSGMSRSSSAGGAGRLGRKVGAGCCC